MSLRIDTNKLSALQWGTKVSSKVANPFIQVSFVEIQTCLWEIKPLSGLCVPTVATQKPSPTFFPDLPTRS
jgi:hypothetical protein